MTWNKNWYSNIMWVCSSVLSLFLLIGVSDIILEEYQIAEKYNILPGYNRVIWLTVCCLLFFVVSLFVFLLIRLLVGRIGAVALKGSARAALEGLCFSGLLAGGILYRLNVFPGEIAENAYFRLAAVDTPGPVEPLAHGALYLYILLLRGLFLLVGNQLFAGLILQMVLQFVSAVLVYVGVRKIAGAFPALWTFGFMMFAPYFVEVSLCYTPEVLYLLLFGGMLCLWSGLLGMIKRAESGKWYHFVLTFVFGIGVAFMTYLDALGAVLLCMGLALLGVKRETKFSAIPLLLMTLLGAILGFIGIFGIDARLSHSSLTAIMRVWEWLFVPGSGSLYYLYHQILFKLSDNGIVSLLIFIGLFWSAFGFFTKKKKESQIPWFWMMLSGVVLSYACGASGNMDRSFLGLFGMIILAGKGIQLTFTKKEEQDMQLQMQEETEEISAEEPEQSAMSEENVTEEALENMVTEIIETVEDIPEKEVTQEVITEIQYIENPLPLPKKHVKKTMDYGFEISDEQMGFDIEIGDEDDFDL